MSDRTESGRKPYEKPEVVTYDQNELVLDTVFTQNNGSGDSDRNLKRGIRPVQSGRILDRLTRTR
jgi:hypothetical protein